MLYISFLLLCLLGQPENSLTECHVQLYIVTKDGFTPWTKERIEEREEVAKKIYQQAGVKLVFFPVETFEAPKFYKVEDSLVKHLDLCLMTNSVLRKDNRIPMFLVDEVYYGEKKYGGITVFDLDMERRAIIVSQAAEKSVFAHELGHFFGLRHPWDDSNFKCEDSFDCKDLENRCNIMSYCFERSEEECQNMAFSESQKEKIQKVLSKREFKSQKRRKLFEF